MCTVSSSQSGEESFTLPSSSRTVLQCALIDSSEKINKKSIILFNFDALEGCRLLYKYIFVAPYENNGENNENNTTGILLVGGVNY